MPSTCWATRAAGATTTRTALARATWTTAPSARVPATTWGIVGKATSTTTTRMPTTTRAVSRVRLSRHYSRAIDAFGATFIWCFQHIRPRIHVDVFVCPCAGDISAEDIFNMFFGGGFPSQAVFRSQRGAHRVHVRSAHVGPPVCFYSGIDRACFLDTIICCILPFSLWERLDFCEFTFLFGSLDLSKLKRKGP